MREVVGPEVFSRYQAFLKDATEALLAYMFVPDEISYLVALSALISIFDFGNSATRTELAAKYSGALQGPPALVADRHEVLGLIPKLWPYSNQSHKQTMLITLAHLEEGQSSTGLSAELESSWEYIERAIAADEELITLTANLIRHGRADSNDAPACRIVARRLLRDRVPTDELVARLLEPSSLDAAIENNLRRALTKGK